MPWDLDRPVPKILKLVRLNFEQMIKDKLFKFNPDDTITDSKEIMYRCVG